MSQESQEITYNADIPATPFQYLWYLSKPFKWWAFGSMLAVVFASGIYQSTGLIFKHIVDAVDAGNFQNIALFGLMLPFALFLVQVFYRASSLCALRWIAGQEEKGYNELAAYITLHSHGYFIDRFAGSLLSKVQNVTTALFALITDILWTYLSAVVAVTVSLIYIARVDMYSAFIFLALLITLVFVNVKLTPKKGYYSRATSEQATKMKGRMVDIFTNAIAMRQYAARNEELKNIATEVREYRCRGEKGWLYTEFMLFTNVTALFLFSSGMFYLLSQRWIAKEITSGDFILVLTLMIQLTGTLTFLGKAFSNTAKQIGEATEGLHDIVVPHEIIDRPNAQQLHVTDGAVMWKSVDFEFGENNVFSNFDLAITPGQRVGLVGPSGAGKTTFVSLLLRQHDITKGSIEIDGQNIAKVTQDSLRSNIAVVPQEPLLFHRSIRENIAYGKSDATDKEVIAVAKKAEAHEFIKTLPEGYDTLVGERGVKLSGGQRQRIVIARAMLKNAPILILDEATSALDSESEVAIQKALHELMEGKTVIAIAHRLSTLREMDRILVLDGGVIVEDGNHSELVGQGGLYAKLWEHQAGGFLQE